MKKAETFKPTALLKVIIKDKGAGSVDFCTVGEIKLKHQNGLVSIMRWSVNDKAAVYRDKNGYWHVDWYLEDFDKDFFETNNPLTRPNWSYLVTGDIVEMPLDIFCQEDAMYAPKQIKPDQIEITDFSILVKEKGGCIASYPFLKEQLDQFMKEGN